MGNNEDQQLWIYQKYTISRVVTEWESRKQGFPGCGDEQDHNKQVTQKHPLKR